jgi:type VI secretion system secreted protein VgrG
MSSKQAGRPLTITTPLGPDKLLIRGLRGREAVSQLFRYELDLIADNKLNVPFDQLLGKTVTAHIDLSKGGKRHISGQCVRMIQGFKDPRNETFIEYRMEIVPKLWFLTRKAQSRIFQHMTVPDILKKVLTGLDVSYEIQGNFQPRDFCVQYRETDFNFASRLMEEEGIFYFFKHSEGSHTMVVANSPSSFPDLPGPSALIFEGAMGGNRDEDRVIDWEKVQDLRSGKVTLWDHSFELPHKHLEADKQIQDSVSLGTVSHKMKLSENSSFEIYDFPGEYAQRFDGVNKGGGDQPAEVQKIFEDNKRTVAIRMEEEASESVRAEGASNVRQMTAGHKFTLQRHFNADGGPYVITELRIETSGAGEFRGGVTGAFRYENHFVAVPQALPYRPARTTPKPVVAGSQTAVVVGPSGEEIFTDKYSRVKVQFHWDREGKNNEDSSCWIRVATHWAGKQWGQIHIPRIGQEVVVDFLEGDPDQPIIVGSVYNADMMPPYQLPANKTQSGIKTRSSLKGDTENFNELCFEDKKGEELVYLRAERNLTIAVEADEAHWVGHDRYKNIGHDEEDWIENDWTIKVDGNRTATIGKDDKETVGQSQTVTIGTTQDITVGTNQSTTVSANQSESVGAQKSVTVGATQSISVGGSSTETVASSSSETVGVSKTVTVGATKTESVGGSSSMQVGGMLSIQTGGMTTITAGGATSVTAGGAITITAGGAISITAGGAVAITAAGAVTLTASAIMLVGVVLVGGVLITPTVIAASVVSPLYTPGVGNMI